MIHKYEEALKRLIDGVPKVIPKNSKINNDNVAREAGRKKGSIRSDRVEFSSLIEKIKDAQKIQKELKLKDKNTIKKLKDEKSDIEYELEQAHVKILMLENYIKEAHLEQLQSVSVQFEDNKSYQKKPWVGF
jgi:hypothetical protein